MVKEVKISLGGKEYLVKQSYRSLLYFEEMTGRGIVTLQQNIKDLLQLFYCMVKANNKIEFTFDEFITLIDNEPESMDAFNKYLVDAKEEEKPEETPVKKKREKVLKS
jgi:hypothetical protein